MTMITNLIIIMLAINLGLFVFGKPEVNSPMLALIKNIYQISQGTGDWGLFISSYATLGNLTIFGILMGVITLGALATGANWLTTGGGYGSMTALKILAIAIFLPLLLMPNFAEFGFPATIEYILIIIFGGMITVTVIELLRS